MAAIVGIYKKVPRIRRVVTNKIITPEAGVNPVDIQPVALPNIRGALTFEVTSADNNFTWSLEIDGGIGQFPQCCDNNFAFIVGSNTNSTVTTPQVNRIMVTTPAGDAGGRVYVLQFYPFSSIGPTIQKTLGVNIGNNNLTVRITKFIVTESY